MNTTTVTGRRLSPTDWAVAGSLIGNVLIHCPCSCHPSAKTWTPVSRPSQSSSPPSPSSVRGAFGTAGQGVGG